MVAKSPTTDPFTLQLVLCGAILGTAPLSVCINPAPVKVKERDCNLNINIEKGNFVICYCRTNWGFYYARDVPWVYVISSLIQAAIWKDCFGHPKLAWEKPTGLQKCKLEMPNICLERKSCTSWNVFAAAVSRQFYFEGNCSPFSVFVSVF